MNNENGRSHGYMHEDMLDTWSYQLIQSHPKHVEYMLVGLSYHDGTNQNREVNVGSFIFPMVRKSTRDTLYGDLSKFESKRLRSSELAA